MGIPWEYHGIPPNHPLKSQLFFGALISGNPRGEHPQNLSPFSMRPSSILMENDLVIHESLDRGVQEQFLPRFFCVLKVYLYLEPSNPQQNRRAHIKARGFQPKPEVLVSPIF